MIAKLHHSKIQSNPPLIAITGSKSESNRLLILQALFQDFDIENCSNSDDSEVMKKALSSATDVVDIHHAGTAMRFLTAYFAAREGREVILTGSQRMKERPIKILVDALNALGASITYTENEGYPPLKISGKKLTQQHVAINANVSSQYISALLLIGAKLDQGLVLELEGEITSWPYINLTLQLLEKADITARVDGKKIIVAPKLASHKTDSSIIVESDWSSASYYYSLVALSPVGTSLSLQSFTANAQQGDAALVGLYEAFGVASTFNNNTLTLTKKSHANTSITLELNDTPDIAQTIIVTCLGLNIPCHLSGLHTLKIKETDRLLALKNELEKFGASVEVTNETITLTPVASLNAHVRVDTYNDHRMAMAFAPLALKTSLQINDAMVVSKSYPDFWNDLQDIGVKISF